MAAWLLVVAGGLTGVVAAELDFAPDLAATGGAIAVSVAYVVALAVRTGGRPVVFGLLALLIGAAVLLVDDDALRSGAAVLSTTASVVLAVMVTTPAVTVARAVREVLVAVVVAAVGAVAAIGFHPLLSLTRFEYATLALSLVTVLVLVYRLAAGLHGLGRRGVVVLVSGSALLVLGLAYAELLRLYGTPGFVTWLLDAAEWSQENLNGVPRPMQSLLGIPMLLWGVHLRARRRQGWWACAFGVVGLVPLAHVLADPRLTLVEAGLTELYSIAAGLLVGVLIIRADLLLRGSGGGRRAAREEEATAVRPEARRTQPLL